MYPVKLDIEDKSLSEQIMDLKEQINIIPNHGLGYGMLKYDHGSIAKSNRELADIRFNYLGQFDVEVNNSLFSYSDTFEDANISPDNQMTTKIEINCMMLSGVLNFEIKYNRLAHKKRTMLSIRKDYFTNLRSISQHLVDEKNMYFTPSDFDTVELEQSDLEKLFE